MPQSELDVGVEISETSGAISLITQMSGALGHSMIAIEYLEKGVVENVVAHLVALPSKKPIHKIAQMDLIRGSSGNKALKTRILIQREGSIKQKATSKFPCRAKTWSALNSKLNDALLEIGVAASLTDTSNPARQDTYAEDWSTSPENYSFIGKLSMYDTNFGINCSNWAVSILKTAGIDRVAGYVIDVPRSLTSIGGLISKL